MKKVLWILVLIVGGLGVFFCWNYMKSNNYQYKIEYHDGYNPGITYEIYIQKNYDMLVVCPPHYAEEKETKVHVKFSKEGKTKVKDILKKMMNEKKEIKLNASDLSSNELIIMESIIYNDEVHLEVIKEETNPSKNLLFELSSGRIDCNSVKLKVYDDNTYQYIEIMNKDGIEESPKSGNYTYDVSKITANNNQYEANDHGPYIMEMSNGETINIYDTNQELKEFLEEIKVSLDTCMQIK